MSNISKVLYRKDSNGSARCWCIKINAAKNGYHTRSGMVNSANMVDKDHLVTPKGNRNLAEQIDLEIKSQISSKIRHGYVESLSECTVDRKLNGLGYPRPMLAKAKVPMDSFGSDHFVQRKYNGLRFLVIMTAQDGLQAYSKSGIKYPLPTHIEDELWNSFDDIPVGQVFDGEIYRHNTPLQKINSWVKKPCDDTKSLTYVVYDVIKAGYYTSRKEYLQRHLNDAGSCVVHATTLPYDSTFIEDQMLRSLYEGYEGLIIRDGMAEYNTGGRTKVMCKIKQFETMEVEIISTKESKLGFAIHTCKVSGDLTVDVLQAGTHEDKRRVYEARDEYVGKVIEISYSELSIDKIPQQPQMLHFRDWD